MFEQFPYADMQQLNLDWMIKIAKDFLDQYTHIQEVITQGLDDLDAKAAALQALLDEWYETHSQDIQNQLAAALADLNAWYTEHQNYLNAYLSDSITLFNQMADTKAAQTLESIPDDYTTMGNNVRYLTDALNLQETAKSGRKHDNYLFSIQTGDIVNTGLAIYSCTKYDIDPDRIYYLTASIRAGDPYFPLIAYLDASNTVIGYQWLNSLDQVYTVTHEQITIPAGTVSCYVNCMNNTGVLYFESTTIDTLENAVNYLDYGTRIKDGAANIGYLFSIDTESLLNIGASIYSSVKYEIDPDRLYFLTASIRAADPYYPLIVYVDANDNLLGYQWLNTLDQVYSVDHAAITIPAGTAYCYVNSMNRTGVLYYEGTNLDDLQQEIDHLEKTFYVGANLSGVDSFTTIRKAAEHIRDNNIMNATVFVNAGVYDLTAELSDVITNTYDGNRYDHGIQFGYNTHWIFAEGAYITFNYNGANTDIADLFSPLVIRGSCTLENMNVEVSNCQYCVHDDWYDRLSNFIVKYINCTMKHNGNTIGTYRDTVCIGGGLLPEELVIVDGGAYTAPGSFNYPISYHSLWADIQGVHPSKIIFRNIWISGAFRLQDAPWNRNSVDVTITNCSMGDDIAGTHTMFTIKEWNNIKRN